TPPGRRVKECAGINDCLLTIILLNFPTYQFVERCESSIAPASASVLLFLRRFDFPAACFLDNLFLGTFFLRGRLLGLLFLRRLFRVRVSGPLRSWSCGHAARVTA